MQLCERIEKKVIKTKADENVFNDYYDVVIVGLGTAGSIAAIAAARKGLKTLGIERLNCMGGQATAGGVFAYYFGAAGGLFENIAAEVNEAEKHGYTRTAGINPD